MDQRADRNPVRDCLRELPYIREGNSAGGLDANLSRSIVHSFAPIVFRKAHLFDRVAHLGGLYVIKKDDIGL